jgi:hypothetical protein
MVKIGLFSISRDTKKNQLQIKAGTSFFLSTPRVRPPLRASARFVKEKKRQTPATAGRRIARPGEPVHVPVRRRPCALSAVVPQRRALPPFVPRSCPPPAVVHWSCLLSAVLLLLPASRAFSTPPRVRLPLVRVRRSNVRSLPRAAPSTPCVRSSARPHAASAPSASTSPSSTVRSGSAPPAPRTAQPTIPCLWPPVLHLLPNPNPMPSSSPIATVSCQNQCRRRAFQPPPDLRCHRAAASGYYRHKN